jgi:hypothetical protein
LAWVPQSFNLLPYSNAALRVRFGHQAGPAAGAYVVSGWNIDDVVITSVIVTPDSFAGATALPALQTTQGTGSNVGATGEADATIRRRRRIRRRIRRRMRRRAVTRMVRGRPFWVVPVGLAVGWELMHDHRVVIVQETRFIERDGARVEVAVVRDSDGRTEQVDLLREDTADNRKDLQGSVLSDDDKSTPGVDDEIEEEVDT